MNLRPEPRASRAWFGALSWRGLQAASRQVAAFIVFWAVMAMVVACSPSASAVGPPPSATATPSPTPSPLPTETPVPTATPTPPTLPTTAQVPAVVPTLPANPAVSTTHARFYDLDGNHQRQIAVLADRFEEVYAAVTARLADEPRAPVRVGLMNPLDSPCTARGVAYSHEGPIDIIVLASEDIGIDQLLAVVGHEIAHIVQRDNFGGLVLDPVLGEGGANWASEVYWRRWQGWPSFDAAVRSYVETGRYVPIAQSPSDCTPATRDISYGEWASFVGYLVDRYGLDRYQAAARAAARPRSRQPAVRPGGFYPDGDRPWYDEVYGKSLAELEAEWLTEVTVKKEEKRR